MYKFEELFTIEPDFKLENMKEFRSFPTEESIQETIKALEAKNHNVVVVDNEEQALNKIKEIIPDNSSVMGAGSVTLSEIGFSKYYFSDEHKWVNLHKQILAETDPIKQGHMRKSALASDYFLSSVGAISKQGDLFVADASGTRTGGFTAGNNLIVVAGVNKIVANKSDGEQRATVFCYNCESVRARKAYNGAVKGSTVQNFIQVRCGALGKRASTVILIRKLLGY